VEAAIIASVVPSSDDVMVETRPARIRTRGTLIVGAGPDRGWPSHTKNHRRGDRARIEIVNAVAATSRSTGRFIVARCSDGHTLD